MYRDSICTHMSTQLDGKDRRDDKRVPNSKRNIEGIRNEHSCVKYERDDGSRYWLCIDCGLKLECFREIGVKKYYSGSPCAP